MEIEIEENGNIPIDAKCLCGAFTLFLPFIPIKQFFQEKRLNTEVINCDNLQKQKKNQPSCFFYFIYIG